MPKFVLNISLTFLLASGFLNQEPVAPSIAMSLKPDELHVILQQEAFINSLSLGWKSCVLDMSPHN